MDGMIPKTQLALMDFNDSMCNEQATTAVGSLSYKQVSSRVTQSSVVKKVMKNRNRSYLGPLLRLTLDMTPNNNKNYLPILGDIPKYIANKDKPDEATAIRNIKPRFLQFIMYMFPHLQDFFYLERYIFRFLQLVLLHN